MQFRKIAVGNPYAEWICQWEHHRSLAKVVRIARGYSNTTPQPNTSEEKVNLLRNSYENHLIVIECH